jgi:CDP-L-myo-inositol myo-inositolphosphotransferase
VTANIQHLIVSVGHEAEMVREHFTDIAARRRMTIEFVEATEWQLGNGASALAAKGHTGKAPFFLVMTDHLFDPDIARLLARNVPAAGKICLAVDRDKEGIFDLNQVTRVRLADNRVVEIGKDLEEWDAADTGIMLCTAGLFDGLERATAKGLHNLSDGLRELAREDRVTTVDVTGRSWLDIDTPRDLHEAENRLMSELGSKASDGPISRHLNRPISRLMSRCLVRTPIRPNHISLISLVLCGVAAALFTLGSYPALAAGGLIAQFASILDGCDGEIARLKKLESDFGGWFDAVLDRYADALLLVGLTWGEFTAAASHMSLAIGFAAIIGSFMSSYTAEKYDRLMVTRLQGAPYLRLGRDVRLFVICAGALLNQPLLTLALVALLMNAEVIRRIIRCAREEQ